MTLGDFFELMTLNPSVIIFFFLAVPLTALLAGIFGRREGHLSPWKYLYTILIYFAAIPGIFAITLNVYLFLFERISVFSADIYTQILPILSMVLTFYLIRRNVSLDRIPGFDKISGLIMIVTCLITLMWVLEKTHIIAFTFLPFTYVIGIFAVILILVRVGWSRIMG